MALEYGLYVQTDLNPKQVLKRLYTYKDIDPHIEKSNARGVFTCSHATGLRTSTYRFKANEPSFIAADFGVDARLLVIFRLSKFKDWEAQVRTMLQATLQLLREIPGDAVLLFNGELVWLIRKAGELTLNRRTDLWRPEFLKLVTPPYKMEEIPIL